MVFLILANKIICFDVTIGQDAKCQEKSGLTEIDEDQTVSQCLVFGGLKAKGSKARKREGVRKEERTGESNEASGSKKRSR